MRTTSAFCLLLLAGCAAAQPRQTPQPQTGPRQPVIRLAPGIASATIPDSAKWVQVIPARIQVVTGACQTNDPMPTALYDPNTLPPSLAMPNGQTPYPPAYIPNACPVTVGPLAQQSRPASFTKVYPVHPEPRPEPKTEGQP